MSTTHTLDPAILDEIVRRIVEVAQPERIILFGSAARGTMGPHSDVDLLVVKAGEFRRLEVTREIYRNLGGLMSRWTSLWSPRGRRAIPRLARPGNQACAARGERGVCRVSASSRTLPRRTATSGTHCMGCR